MRAYLKEHRLAAGLTLAEAADAVGVTVTSVWRWENDKASPQVEALSKLAAAYSVPTEQMFRHPDASDASASTAVMAKLVRTTPEIIEFCGGELDRYHDLPEHLKIALTVASRLPACGDLALVFEALSPERRKLAISTLKGWVKEPG